MVVPQDAEVSEMSVLIIDHRIEHQHTLDLLIGFRSKLPVILQAGFQATLPHNATDRDIGGVNIREQLAAGGQDALPVFQLVGHRIQAHGLGDLAGVKLAVRLIPGVGRAEGSAFVQIDALALDKSPCLGEHPVGGQLRRGGKGRVALSDAGVGHQGQDLREAVLI